MHYSVPAEPPTYEVVEEGEDPETECFTIKHENLYKSRDESNKVIQNTVSEEQRVKYTNATWFKAATFKKNTIDLKL